MLGKLESALRALLGNALPDLIGGDSPPVKLELAAAELAIDPSSQEAQPSAPRPDDRTDLLPFDPAKPAGPYLLTQSPYEGPRRVRLRTSAGDFIALRESEIAWDRLDGRRFQLALRADRDLSSIHGVQILYGVTAVFTRIKATQSAELQLTSNDADKLDRAEALVIAAIALNRPLLAAQAASVAGSGNYSGAIEVKDLKLVRGTAAAGTRRLELRLDVELKAARALDDGEGARIERTDIHVLLG